MKKLKTYHRGIVLFTMLIFFSSNQLLFARGPLPKKIAEEKKNFHSTQISPDHKLFLGQLMLSFQYLITVTTYTSEILDSLPSLTKLDYSRFTRKLQKKVKKIMPELIDFEKSGQSLNRFIREYLNDNKNDLKNNFEQLVARYRGIERIDPSSPGIFGKDVPTDGAYHYYILRSDNLNHPPPEALSQTIVDCRKLGELAINHKIEKLKKFLPETILFLENAYSEITDDLLKHLPHTSSSWGCSMLLRTIRLAQQQILFNKNFISSIADKIKVIPTPQQARLPDLKVVAIKMTSKEMIKVGAEINVNVAIRNTGNLTVDSSQAKITFPNNETKIITVPKLEGGQTHTEALRYKLDKVGRNDFRVRANSDFKTWESDISNNLTKRALILE